MFKIQTSSFNLAALARTSNLTTSGTPQYGRRGNGKLNPRHADHESEPRPPVTCWKAYRQSQYKHC